MTNENVCYFFVYYPGDDITTIDATRGYVDELYGKEYHIWEGFGRWRVEIIVAGTI